MGKILIIDDEEHVRKTLKALLQSGNYEFHFAENGRAGLEKAAELLPDLILLDVMMPVMNGYVTCERLRVDERTREIPIIMLTALDDTESRLKGLKAGAEEFITKPCSRVELQTRVQTIMKLNRYRRLLAEREKFAWVVERAETGYLIVKREGEIVYANQRADLYLGMNGKRAAPEKRFFDSLVDAHYNRIPPDVWTTWPVPPTDCGMKRYLVRPETADDAAFWLQVDSLAISESNTDEYLVRLTDVSEQIANHILTWSLHRQIGHKLRTPLNGIIGSLGLLADEEMAMEPEEERNFKKAAYESAARLQNEIDNIFKFINVFSPQNALGFCTVSEVSSIAEEMAGENDVQVGGVSPRLTTMGDDVVVKISANGLRQVFWELIDNSRKFHPNASPAIEIRVGAEADRLILTVVDDGITLSPAQFTRIWRPYYQGCKAFTGEVPGTGLGLSVVAALIWGAGGSCRAYNRPEANGFAVELTLPLTSRSSNGVAE